MDATTNIQTRLPSRVATCGATSALQRSGSGAPAFFDANEIFKKTRDSADSKPHGRYVAKDIAEVVSIPVLTTIQSDLTATDRPVAEKFKFVTRSPTISCHPGRKADRASHADA